MGTWSSYMQGMILYLHEGYDLGQLVVDWVYARCEHLRHAQATALSATAT